MNCNHKVKWTVRPPEDCRFRLSVSHYKDRIVAPDEYSGATEVTPSHIEQVLPTTDKLVREDITVLPAPTEYLSTDHNGTFTPSDGKVGFSQVDVNVQPEVTYDELASGEKPSGDITLSVINVATTVFRDKWKITSIHAPNCVSVVNFAFSGCSGVTEIEFPKLENVGNNAFTNIRATHIVLPALKTAGAGAFASQPMVRHICVGENVETLATSFFNNMQAGWSIKLKGKPTSIATNAFASTSSGDVYVPWSQGEVANAPWGASKATIHYDTVYDENWNVISST